MLRTARIAARRPARIATAWLAAAFLAAGLAASAANDPAKPAEETKPASASAKPSGPKPEAAPAPRGGSGGRGGQASGPVPILAATAERRTVPIVETAVGTVEANATVQVKALVAGVLDKVHFEAGQMVKKGDLLFSIDARPFQAAVKKQEAALAKDEAQARYTEADAARYAKLVKDAAASKEDAERARATADSAAAQVAADRAEIDAARLLLEYCSIKAPFDGRVGDILVDAGNVIKANDIALVTIHQTHPIAVSFTLAETDLADVLKAKAASAKPLRVEAAIPGDSGQPVEGSLTFIDNEVDRQTGMIRMKAAFANEDDRLWPGLFVNVTIRLGQQEGAVVVPTEAIQSGQQGTYVYVVKDDNTVVNRKVTAGRVVDGHTAVTEGLAEGERVVTDGHLRLRPGAQVAVKASLDEAAAAAATAPRTGGGAQPAAPGKNGQ